jgi:hypothetical protein
VIDESIVLSHDAPRVARPRERYDENVFGIAALDVAAIDVREFATDCDEVRNVGRSDRRRNARIR